MATTPLDLLNTVCSFNYLIIECGSYANNLKNKRACHYFMSGLIRRLIIIRSSLVFFQENIAPGRDTPLSDDEVNSACLHINSFYVNLYGAIDNIAWVYAYEKRIVSMEDNIEASAQKRQIALFNKAFLEKIGEINVAYKCYLDGLSDWYSKLSNSRHPSAHRIPLYVIPSILNSSEANEYTYHQKMHLKSSAQHQFEKADEHYEKLQNMGKFIPLFAHDPDIKPVSIYPTIIDDGANLVSIVRKSIEALGEA